MKIYRTTRTNEKGVVWIRYSTTRRTYASAKSSWFNSGERNKLTLQSIEVPDDGWKIEEAVVDY